MEQIEVSNKNGEFMFLIYENEAPKQCKVESMALEGFSVTEIAACYQVSKERIEKLIRRAV